MTTFLFGFAVGVVLTTCTLLCLAAVMRASQFDRECGLDERG